MSSNFFESKLKSIYAVVDVDNGEVVVGNVDGDRPRGEEDQGLEQSLCLQEQLVSLLLVEVFRSSDGIQNRVDNRPSAIFYISN